MAVQWLGNNVFTAVAGVQFLVGELRSRKPCGVAKKENKISCFCILALLLYYLAKVCISNLKSSS